MQKTVDLIIKAKHILQGKLPFIILNDHAIVIHQGNILDIAPQTNISMQYQAKQTTELNHHIILPGLINCHTHIGMNLMRGYADDLELYTWLTKYIWPCEHRYANADFVRDSNYLACAEMIRSGTTCFNDMYFFPEITAEIIDEVGMRAFLGASVLDVPTQYAHSVEEYLQKGLDFIEKYSAHPKITPTLAAHSTYTLKRQDLMRIHEIAQEKNLKINIHLQESPADIENCLKKNSLRPLRLLHELGMTSSQLIGIHFTTYDIEDLSILAETHTRIVHCPESNLKLASGLFRIQSFKELNILVGLGTDSVASNNDLNLWGEMRTAAFLAKILAQDPRCFPAGEVLALTTCHAAQLLGISSQIGSLEIGHAGDMIAVDINEIEMQPCFDLLSHLVYAADRSLVTHTWVNGRCLMEKRECLTLDLDRVRYQTKKWQETLKII